MVGSAKQHRLGFERSASLAIGEHMARDEASLVSVVGDRDQQGQRTVRPIGVKRLGEALGRERDCRVGCGKDGAA